MNKVILNRVYLKVPDRARNLMELMIPVLANSPMSKEDAEAKYLGIQLGMADEWPILEKAAQLLEDELPERRVRQLLETMKTLVPEEAEVLPLDEAEAAEEVEEILGANKEETMVNLAEEVASQGNLSTLIEAMMDGAF
jgi:hypothetical protein